jgi:D-glycero-D-manno-heptose 1,7-bisphosphate phosphatase
LLGAYVAERTQLLLVDSSHELFLSVSAVETRDFSGTLLLIYGWENAACPRFELTFDDAERSGGAWSVHLFDSARVPEATVKLAGYLMNHRATFLDLNGTLVLPIKPQSLSELTLIEGAAQAIARLSRAGFLCPVVTVQSRIAKGFFSSDDFRKWFYDFSTRLRSCGAEIVGPYVCPHRFREPCECKKPGTFLYELAASEHGVDLQRSFVIGDSADDVCAAYRFGGQGCLVRTGWAQNPVEVERAAPYASFVAESLSKAVDWILSQSRAGV